MNRDKSWNLNTKTRIQCNRIMSWEEVDCSTQKFHSGFRLAQVAQGGSVLVSQYNSVQFTKAWSPCILHELTVKTNECPPLLFFFPKRKPQQPSSIAGLDGESAFLCLKFCFQIFMVRALRIAYGNVNIRFFT